MPNAFVLSAGADWVLGSASSTNRETRSSERIVFLVTKPLRLLLYLVMWSSKRNFSVLTKNRFGQWFFWRNRHLFFTPILQKDRRAFWTTRCFVEPETLNLARIERTQKLIISSAPIKITDFYVQRRVNCFYQRNKIAGYKKHLLCRARGSLGWIISLFCVRLWAAGDKYEVLAIEHFINIKAWRAETFYERLSL